MKYQKNRQQYDTPGAVKHVCLCLNVPPWLQFIYVYVMSCYVNIKTETIFKPLSEHGSCYLSRIP